MNDCTMLWSGIYQQSWKNASHSHIFFQIVGILNGCAILCINDHEYIVNQGQLILIKPQELHSIRVNPDYGSLKVMDMKFSITGKALFQNLMSHESTFKVYDFYYIKVKFNNIIEESERCLPHYYALINCYLYEILVHLLRGAKPSAYTTAVPLLPEQQDITVWKGIRLEELLQYVNANYTSNIRLDDLVRVVNLNKTTLIELFKDLYNTTPMNYINGLRLHKAKDLLVTTDISITEIASLVGFQSLHNFCRYFKTKENKTPNEYRTHNKFNSYFSYN